MKITSLGKMGLSRKAHVLLAGVFALLAHDTVFADAISPARTTTWQGNVGVEGGIPSRTTIYKTLTSANTAGDINSALSSCPAGQVVQLQDGVYNLNTAIVIGQNNVTLRGQGTNTVLHFTGTIGGNGYITFSGPNQNNVWAAENQGTVGGSANWTSGYTPGSSSIVLSSTSGLSVGSVICLDQLNDNIDVSSQGVDGFCNYCGRGGNRSQEQWVKVTAINGTTVSISPSIYMPNWKSSLSPQAWWVSGFVFNSGVESVNIDGSGATLSGGLYPANLYVNGTWNCWVSNVWSEMGQVAHLVPYGGGRLTIQHCWFQGSKSSASMSYGIYPLYLSGGLIENNIFNGVDAPMIPSTGISGSVFAYNYVTNVLFTNPSSWMDASIMTHGAGNCMNLYEGNFVGQWDKDLFHGSSAYETLFRCRVTGNQVGKSGNRIAVLVWPTNHFMNVVGNILGTPGVNTSYGGFVGGSWPDPAIYNVGFGRTGGSSTAANDPIALNTLYLHGNYDTANNGIIWATTNTDHTLPSSLYLTSQPAWFGGTWPPFDPNNGASVAASAAGYTNIPAGYRFVHGTDPATGPVNLPPVVNASGSPKTGTAPLTVNFLSTGSSDPEGKGITYSWTFGDGGTSTAANPSHVYATAGSFTAQLTVSDSVNTTSSTNIPILITIAGSNYPPVAVASANVTSGGIPLTVNFSSLGSSDPEGATLTYRWTFGDGITATTANPSHTYTNSGAFSAQLTVSDGTNNITANTVIISVGNSANGLVAAYGFEEGSGTAISDVSGQSNNGVASGTAWSSSGRFGKALSFTTGAMVSINDATSLHLSTAMTLEAWVNPTTLSSSWSDVIYKGGDAYFLMGTTPQSKLPDLGGSFAQNNLYGSTALPLNTWTHLAGTYDGTTMRFYVNGLLVSSQAQTGSIASSTGMLSIGGDSANNQFWTGLIDEVRVYNRALSETEIHSDMNTPVVPGGSFSKPSVPTNLHQP